MGKNSPSSAPAKQKEYRDRFAAKPKESVTEKACRKCEVVKPASDFNRMGASRDGLQSYCRECNNARRRVSLLASHGITQEIFDATIEAQGGRCAICSKPPVRQGTVTWAIDHDHNHCPGETGCEECFRGLLCNTCNRGLGFFGDSPDALMSAVAYLLGKGA